MIVLVTWAPTMDDDWAALAEITGPNSQLVAE
jgi:hypothetical protein